MDHNKLRPQDAEENTNAWHKTQGNQYGGGGQKEASDLRQEYGKFLR